MVFPVTAISLVDKKEVIYRLKVAPPIKASCPTCKRDVYVSMRRDLLIDRNLLIKAWMAHCDKYGCPDELRPVVMLRVTKA